MKYTVKRSLPPGFTLVEVMVAMVITLIVMGGAYRTLTDENVNHDQSEKILDMQNNARVALERITRDVRRAGSLGCGGNLVANTIKNTVIIDPPATTFVNDYTIASNLAVPPGWNWDGGQSILSMLKDLALGGTNVNFLS
jgi:prepilin-type N-terminal cleavage/methylation domain-containing protein